MNEAGQESANADMTAGRTLPWLQDTLAADTWKAWNVTYRDVRIVDATGRVRSVYNLSANDLGVPANSAALKQLMLDAR